MATYIIGDVQGCFDALQDLVKKIDFAPNRDRLWFVGDLVNRGSQSLETLRWVRSLGSSAVCVLGNHDLYCLRVATEPAALRKRQDTLQALLDAPDCPALMTWLRHRPLLHVEQGVVLVHAGLLPAWTVHQAQQLAAEVETLLRSNQYAPFLQNLWGNSPSAWNAQLTGQDRMRLIVNALTRMRFCHPDGSLDFEAKGPPDKAASTQHIPWFDVQPRQNLSHTIFFGHWSALGYQSRANTVSLDTGCIWGGMLTAMRLEDRKLFQVAPDPASTLPVEQDA